MFTEFCSPNIAARECQISNQSFFYYELDMPEFGIECPFKLALLDCSVKKATSVNGGDM